MTGNPARSSDVGFGDPEITFGLSWDQPTPRTPPSTRTRRYSTSANCDDCCAHWPLSITRACWRVADWVKLSIPPKAALKKHWLELPAPAPNKASVTEPSES